MKIEVTKDQAKKVADYGGVGGGSTALLAWFANSAYESFSASLTALQVSNLELIKVVTKLEAHHEHMHEQLKFLMNYMATDT